MGIIYDSKEMLIKKKTKTLFSLWFAVLYICLYIHHLSDRTEQPMATEDFLLLLSGLYIVKTKEAQYLTTARGDPKKGPTMGSIWQNDLGFRIKSHMHSLSEGERSGINDLADREKDKVLLMNRYFRT